jgi:formylglycine-generating enzyme required for sulfatase activity
LQGNNPGSISNPANSVTWISACEFCNKLSLLEGLDPCYTFNHDNVGFQVVEFDENANGYRLPTEAEWEYAARGGIHYADNYCYSGSNEYDDVATDDVTYIGSKAPNQLGIYDMTGNVAEFCWDYYAEYSDENQVDPQGPDFGDTKVVRGSEIDVYGNYTLSQRYSIGSPYSSTPIYGIRLVRNAE